MRWPPPRAGSPGLLRDCVDNFAAIRTSLEAALAASGKFAITPGRAAYTVGGRISDVGTSGQSAAGTDFGVGSDQLFVNMDVTVKE